MERFQRGDAGAFDALVRRHRTAVYAFLVRLGGDAARAEDLAQETWLKAIAAAPRWERRARVTTWVFAIARNVALDDARRRALRAPAGDPPAAGEGLASTAPGPDRGADSALLRPKLEAAIAALPEEQREVFALREYGGVPFAEIAEITGAPLPTVKSRMRYALEALRESLARMGVLPDGAGEAPWSAAR